MFEEFLFSIQLLLTDWRWGSEDWLKVGFIDLQHHMDKIVRSEPDDQAMGVEVNCFAELIDFD